MSPASLNRRARERLMSHCPTEADLRTFTQDYLPEQLSHIPEQVSLQEKFSRLIERAGAEVVIRFQTVAEKTGEIYLSGRFTFAIMDFSKGLPRRAPMPDWIEAVFFEKK